jgi:NAD(P)-dependent dehydrogenase (short-subunit alcohol dehydrogenase family)
MNRTLKNRKAIVTGGTRGIGRAIAKMLLEGGAEVAIFGRSGEGAANAARELADETGGKIVASACDITKVEEIRKFFAFADDQLGSYDILVNNAGVGIFRSVGELAPEDWQRTIDTNLTGVYHCCHLAVERFRKAGGGHIVNIASLAGKNAFAGGAAYNASKFGLVGFSEALMLDHRYDNVRVTTVLPGSVATDFGRGGGADWKIQPEDVAEVVRMAVSMPERTMVSSIEMRPARPAK